MDWVNRNEIRLIGLSRSGNHALVHWILAQADGRAVFLNCCEGKHNPFASARPMGDGRVALHAGRLDLDAERAGHLSRKDWLIYSHEDSFLGNACSDLHEQRHDDWVGPSRRRHDVLLLRDPFNLLASRLRAVTGHNSVATTMRIWKQHAREFLRPKRLRHAPVTVSYNRWCVDRDYRREIAERLGLAFTDAGRDRVCATHGGSSFDGVRYDGRAEHMDVFGRWQSVASDPRFVAAFDERTLELADEIFGDLPAAAHLRQLRDAPSAAASSRARRSRASADSSGSGAQK